MEFGKLTNYIRVPILLLFLFISVIAKALTFTVDNIKYLATSDTTCIVAMDNSTTLTGDISIPRIVVNEGVSYIITKIGSSAFVNCSKLTSVTIPNSVTSIGISAFQGCSRIVNLIIPNSITSIGSSAFSGLTNLSSITIPHNVKSLPNSVFSSCKSLVSIFIPSSINWIDERAFYNCTGLETIYFEEGIKTINSLAFYNCIKLSELTLPNSLAYVGEDAFMNCSSLITVKVGKDLSNILKNPFLNCTNLKDIEVDVSNIHYASFEGVLFTKDKKSLVSFPNMHLTDYIVPDEVDTIRSESFAYCANLKSITISEGVSFIGNSAFWDCKGMKTYIVKEKNEYYASVNGTLFDREMKNLINYPISNISSEYIIPEGILSIGEGAFLNCHNLTNVFFPNSINTIGLKAFENCTGLTTFDLPNSLKTIEYGAFSDCSNLTHLIISNSVTDIKSYAFENCQSLKIIVIGIGVKFIYPSAFSNCTGLTEIHCLNMEPPNIDNNTFFGLYKDGCSLSVPKGSLITYKSSSLWGLFTNIVEDKEVSLHLENADTKSTYTNDNLIILNGCSIGEKITIFNSLGVMIKSVKATSVATKIILDRNQLYIVKRGGNSMKLFL